VTGAEKKWKHQVILNKLAAKYIISVQNPAKKISGNLAKERPAGHAALPAH